MRRRGAWMATPTASAQSRARRRRPRPRRAVKAPQAADAEVVRRWTRCGWLLAVLDGPVAIAPEELFAADVGVAPEQLIAPEQLLALLVVHGVAPEQLIAPQQLIAPKQLIAPQQLIGLLGAVWIEETEVLHGAPVRADESK